MRVARVDRRTIRLDADIATDGRGFAQIWGTVITAGKVLEYGPADGFEGPHFELVPEETVFDEESLATLMHAPITFLHPQEAVDATNSGRLTVGHIIDLKREGDELRALHQVEDATTLDRIRGGTVELSPGYTVELDNVPGITADGVHFDSSQFGRRYNHEAIVPMARAGADNRLSIDSGVIPGAGLRVQVGPEQTTMKTKVKIDGKTVEVDAAQLEKLQALLGDLGVKASDADDDEDSKDAEGDPDEDKDEDSKDAESDDDDSKDEDAKSKDSKDSGPIDVAALTASITAKVTADMASKFETERKASLDAIQVRGKLVADARGGLPASYVYEGQSDRQVMLDTIKALQPDFVARAKKLDASALAGAFQFALAQPRGDIAGEVMKTDSGTKRVTMQDCVDLQRRRVLAAQDCGEAGQFAAKHADVRAVKLAAGGGQ